MPQVKMRMPFGEIIFEFADNQDLKNQLDKVNFVDLEKTIREKVGSIAAEPKKIREEIKDICDTDGTYVILKKTPATKVDRTILAIYAYGTSATVDEIRHTTGISDPSGDVINSGSSSKYFMSFGNKTYGLSDLGIQSVTNEILPGLRKKE